MKNAIMKCWCAVLAAILMLGMVTVGIAEKGDTANMDPVSGQPLNADIENVYKDRFEEMCKKYEDQLSEEEKYRSNKVYDAIGSMSFSPDQGVECMQRIFNISSAEDLHGILTGYFDPKDATYVSDDALKSRLEQILTACGLDLADYYLSVTRNVPGLPDPITKDNWYCTLALKEAYSPEEGGDSIILILCGAEMQAVTFIMNADIL